MGLSFLNPALLGALSLVSVPIIIHLLQRRRFKVVRWGAMEFLRISQKNRSRRLMLEQLLLLLIRCLIVAFVVLAVCRPLVRSSALPLAGSRGTVHAVILLDNSYSMGYRPQGAESETLFDRAVRRALELVERGLKQGDGVSVVLTSDPPRVLIRRPSLDLPAVAAALKGVRLSDAGTNYGRAARAALEILEESSFPNREVFLLGDLQANGWEGRSQDSQAWEALAHAGRVMVLPVHDASPSNAAVEWVQAARGLATVRASTRIQARIVNYGSAPLRAATVTLEVDGKPQGTTQRVDVEPGQGALVAFNQSFDQPGIHRCTVRVSQDRLPLDDAGYLALRVRRNVRVLVVNGKSDAATPQKDAGFFLTLALNPPAEPGAEPTAIEPREVRGSSFAGQNLREFDVAVLSNVAALGESDRRLMAEFVQNGGGVLIFPGDRVNADLYNRDLFQAKPSLLPARLGAVRSGTTALDPGSLDHPALQRFKGAQDVDLQTADFTRWFTLEPDPEDRSVRVVARFGSGQPAVVEKQFGLGRVILAASGATTEWNTLPVRPVFLPLIHQLVAYLATGADGTRNGEVGQPMVKPLPLEEARKRVTLTDPTGARSTTTPVVDERGATVTLEAPALAGFWSVEVEEGSRDVFAVNRNTAESNLRTLGEAALRRLLPYEWSWVGHNEDLVGALTRSRQGVELWRHFLFAALLLLFLETMLAQVFGRRA